MKLYYRVYGSGHPLIILHGLFGSSDNWISIAKSLSTRFMVVLPDQRNHGRSQHSLIHDYHSMSDDLAGLINELGWNKFFLAGHSMGGKTAVRFALDRPEKLNGLLVADISPFTRYSRNSEDFRMHRQILDFMINENISGIKSRKEIDSLLRKNIKSSKVRGLVLKNLRRESDNSFFWGSNAISIMRNLDRIADRVEPAGNFSGEVTGFPIIFLKGENSHYLRENEYTNILRIFPGAEFITIPQAGHWIHADNPGAVRSCFMKFLQDS